MSMSESTKTMLQHHINKMQVLLDDTNKQLAEARIVVRSCEGTGIRIPQMAVNMLSETAQSMSDEIEQLTNLLKEV